MTQSFFVALSTLYNNVLFCSKLNESDSDPEKVDPEKVDQSEQQPLQTQSVQARSVAGPTQAPCSDTSQSSQARVRGKQGGTCPSNDR